jgi:hypothetical protein
MRYNISIVALLLFGCTETSITESREVTPPPNIQIESLQPKLNLVSAELLISLPLKCTEQEYPNKLSQTLAGDEDLLSPTILHPAFYGCFDWHSSVHGHWSMVKLLKEFPEMELADSAMGILQKNITSENIATELEYFARKTEGSFERTYGWAWLLKLAEELHTWKHPNAKVLEQNLQPLTDVIVTKYLEYLPKLQYPIRVGTHSNTAFGLSFAYDYASTTSSIDLKNLIESRAKDFYTKDSGCPLTWEPSGYDFLSPCLEEIDLMRRILSEEDFMNWLDSFMPELKEKSFTMETGIVGDRTDGHLVHLDGVNFSRAWCLFGLANQYPEFSHLNALAKTHFNYSYPNLIGDDYEGGHWLASFAIMAMYAE